MELAELKRSVDDEVANIKTEKKKEIQDWLKPKAMKPSDWLKEELDKMKENFGNTLSVSQIPDLLDLKKGATKLPDWLKSAPTKQPGESIDSNENVDGAILNELSNGDMIQVNKNEKKTGMYFNLFFSEDLISQISSLQNFLRIKCLVILLKFFTHDWLIIGRNRRVFLLTKSAKNLRIFLPLKFD